MLDQARAASLTDASRQEPSTIRDVSCGSRGAAWYCAQIQPGRELAAFDDLTHPNSPNKRVWAAYLPHVLERRWSRERDGRERSRIATVLMFPGYIFIKFDVRRDPWPRLYGVRGLRHLIYASPGQPYAISEAQMADIRAKQASETAKLEAEIATPFPAGERLKVVAGGWTGIEGVCLWSSKDRVRMLMSLFGRTFEQDLPLGRVKSA